MSSTQRLPEHTVIARLLRAPYRFEFIQAVSLLEKWLGHRHAGRLSPSIRFRGRTALAFATSEVDAIDVDETPVADASAKKARKITLTPALPCLFGSTGELPYAASYRLMETHTRGRLESVQAFYDLLFHRAVELRYLAASRSRIFRTDGNDGKPALPSLLLSIAGSPSGAAHPDCVPATAIASYAGLLSRPTTSARVLQAALKDYFRLPIEVIQFLPDYYCLGNEEKVQLGKQNPTLGKTLTLGKRIPNFQRRVRLRFGPLKRKQYEQLLPDTSGQDALRQFVSLFKLSRLQLEVLLFLERAESPRIRLGEATLGYGYHLGQTARGPHYGAMRYALTTT